MSSYTRIGSVKTTIAILKYLGEQRAPVSGQEIAQAVGIPHGTAMCHLATLADDGFVRETQGWFEIGTGFALLFYRYKSLLEGKIERLNKELQAIGG